MNSRTNAEIRGLYHDIKILESHRNEVKRPDLLDDYIHEIKLQIRKLYRRCNRDAREFAACDRFYHTVDEYGYYNVEYRKYATEMTREEMAEWCDEYYRDHQVHSMYDCTGEHFVSSIRFAKMREGVYLIRIAWGLDL